MKTKLQILSAFKEWAPECYRNENIRGVSRFISKDSLHTLSLVVVFFILNPLLWYSLSSEHLFCKLLAEDPSFRELSLPSRPVRLFPLQVSHSKKIIMSNQSCFLRPGMVCWPTLVKDWFSLQPGMRRGTAGRARERVSDDGMMINLIVTSTALNVRLVQEAHKRKLSAVSWVLLLREQRMQTNKPQHCLRLWPAKEQPGSPAQQCVCCLGDGGAASLGTITSLWLLPCGVGSWPYLTESSKKTVGSREGVCHGCVLVAHQSTSSFCSPLWLFTRAGSMECATEP